MNSIAAEPKSSTAYVSGRTRRASQDASYFENGNANPEEQTTVSNEKTNDKSKSQKSKTKKDSTKQKTDEEILFNDHIQNEKKPLVKRILKSSSKLDSNQTKTALRENVPRSGSHVEFKTATLSKKEKAALASSSKKSERSKSKNLKDQKD